MLFFTILNTLQGVFIFIHFVITVQVLLKNPSNKGESSPLTSVMDHLVKLLAIGKGLSLTTTEEDNV